jgi:hypothetical protein
VGSVLWYEPLVPLGNPTLVTTTHCEYRAGDSPTSEENCSGGSAVIGAPEMLEAEHKIHVIGGITLVLA